MKTRIFSVLGLLLLCGFITTAGSKAWAGVIDGTYACTGSGFAVPELAGSNIPFATSGVAEVSNGVITFPAASSWTANVVGEPVQDIPISNAGNSNGLSCAASGAPQCMTTITFGPIQFLILGKVDLPNDFNLVYNQVVAGVAQEFTLMSLPRDGIQFQIDTTWLIDCRHV